MAHHEAALRSELKKINYSDKKIKLILDALQNGKFEQNFISKQDQVLLRYSAKLNNLQSPIENSDILELRAVGFDDRAIHDIVTIISYFNFVNRMAEGLGVELERRFAK